MPLRPTIGKESEWFDYLDEDGSGTLDESDLCRTGLCTMDPTSGPEGIPSCKVLLDSIDNNNDGRIDFNDFVRWLRKPKVARV